MWITDLLFLVEIVLALSIALAVIDLASPYKLFVMVGKSMKPRMGYLNIGYGVVPQFILIGDVVAFKRQKKYGFVMHRVIGISDSGMIAIKGDNASEIDYVSMDDVLFKLSRFKKIC